MLRFTTGDILAEDAEALVNAVNCVGVMGRGVALQFKKAFPENFRAYAKACQRGEMKLGAVFVFQTGTLTNPRTIINFPTKRHRRGNSRIEAIEAGLKDLVCAVRDRGIRSMAVPPLGCGLGGLDWSIVRPRIEEALGSLNSLDVVVFEPRPVPDVQKTVRSPVLPKTTPGRAALVGWTATWTVCWTRLSRCWRSTSSCTSCRLRASPSGCNSRKHPDPMRRTCATSSTP